MPKAKIKLNDQQWLKLLAIQARQDGAMVAPPGPISCRLRSRGFVARDDAGFDYLTERGALRIAEGR
ncbi:hypothetical protein ACSFBM_16500 [Variovorax sp. GB1R11]|uniref:hypothetical protein n=1 Tax=Variovorax sp. GB1R11 TaxID=3443741 RepID=UPI003F473099